MARLPTVGGDNDNWGTVLSEFLEISHNSDGTIKGNGLPYGTAAETVAQGNDSRINNAVAKTGDGGIFYASAYASIQSAIDACSAAGGGEVRLSPGANQVSAKLSLASRVILSGPPCEVGVWGYSSNPENFIPAWLVADSSTTDPVVEIGSNVVMSGVRNLLIKSNGIRLAVKVADSSNRGDNALRYVNCNRGGIYIGQYETRLQYVIVMLAPGDGITIASQDGALDSVLVGYSGGNGIVLSPTSGPTRPQNVDAFFSTLAGIVIDGSSHRFFNIQADHNGRQGIYFRSATSVVAQGVLAGWNSREYDGITHTTRYPDVWFAHPTGGNVGCQIVGGVVQNDGIGSHGIQTNEAIYSIPTIQNVTFAGTWATGGSAFDAVAPLTNFTIVNCIGIPDITRPRGGISSRYLVPNGTYDHDQFSDGNGNVLSGVNYNGTRYNSTKGYTQATNGALTIDGSLGNINTTTLNANVTSSLVTTANMKTGQLLTMEWIQDGIGNRTYIWPSICKFAGGTAPSASTAPTYRDSVTFRYNGTNLIEISRAIAIR